MIRPAHLLILAALAFPTQARAADQDAGWLDRSMDMARSAGASISGAWRDLTAPVLPSDHLPSSLSEDDRRFFAVLEVLGLQLAEVTIGKGWTGGATYRFVSAREPSDVDLDQAERRYTAYLAAASGFRARAKQKIARQALDTALGGGFTIAAMEITLSPWPDAAYQLTARNRPPELGERRIIENTPKK